MGNRAQIHFKLSNEIQPVGIYLHWNGGRDSIEGFLKAARELSINSRAGDYAITRFSQMISNYFGGLTSIQVDIFKNLPGASDNGVYIVDENTFEILECEQETFDKEKSDEIYQDCLNVNLPIFKR